MNKLFSLLATALLLAAMPAHAALGPEAWRLSLRNNTNTGNLAIDVTNPGVNALIGYDINSTLGRIDGGTGSYQAYLLGTGLNYNSPTSTLSVANLPLSALNIGGTSSQVVLGDGSLGALPTQTPFTVAGPTSRSLSLATAYQCTNTNKPCVLTLSVACPLTLSVLSTQTCAGEVRLGSANTVASGGGTNIAPIQRQAGGILGLSTNDYETKTINVPTGWYFAVRSTTGSPSVVSAFDQEMGN